MYIEDNIVICKIEKYAFGTKKKSMKARPRKAQGQLTHNDFCCCIITF